MRARIFYWLAPTLWVMLLAGAANGAALLSQIRYATSDGSTKVTMDLSSEIRYEAHVLPEEPARGFPLRIYVDLIGSRLAAEAKQPIAVENGLVRRVRAAQFTPEIVRVVLDMASPASYRTSILSDPYRLVVEIQGQENASASPAAEKKKTPPVVAKTKPQVAGLRKIVIDPGHGGRDPGAIGVDGIAEKDIVLAVARKLAFKLKKEMGIEVVLTRADDSFVDLKDRTAMANAEQADLFISLHVNASPNPAARGLETYYLDNTTDEAANRMAARENSVARSSVTDIQFILSDMIQNLKLEDSITLAHRLQSSVVSEVGRRYGEVRDLGVKKALFYVLVGARMPSVLVEMFFVTHRSEGRALAREAYQDAIVDALLEGIKKYQEGAQVVKNL